jgi:hypothetical protein
LYGAIIYLILLQNPINKYNKIQQILIFQRLYRFYISSMPHCPLKHVFGGRPYPTLLMYNNSKRFFGWGTMAGLAPLDPPLRANDNSAPRSISEARSIGRGSTPGILNLKTARYYLE